MKLSVSLSDDDLSYIDDYARRGNLQTRSAVLHKAVAALRMSELEDAYSAAWAEWQESDERDLWESTSADGLADAAR